MNNKKYLVLILLVFSTVATFAQSNTAPEMDPFCAGGSTLTFDNTTNSPPADPDSAADSYGCLGSEPNPAWFYMQIGESGDLEFTLSQTSNTGNGIDVDFILWGPFGGPPPIYGPSNLNDGTTVDCSYSGSATESVSIPDAITGQYYVILITNFSNQPGQINLTQTNTGDAGAGSTNCDIVCPLSLGDGFELCPGNTAAITATIEDATSYEWFQDGAPLAGETGQSLVVSEPGTYSVIVNKPGCVADATASVTITAPDPILINDPEDIVICAVGTPPYTFDLSQNNDYILNGLDPALYDITFHNSAEEASEGIGQIFPASNVENYQSNGGETMYVRVLDVNADCGTYREFQLIGNPAPTPGTPGDLQICDSDDSGDEEFDLTIQDTDVFAGQDPTIYTVTYHETLENAEDNVGEVTDPENYLAVVGTTVIYTRLTNNDNEDCYGVTSFELEVSPNPVVEVPEDQFVCSEPGYTLPAIIESGNYYTEPNGAGTQLNEGDLITTTQTIYVYAESGTSPNNCTAEESFTITVYQKPVIDTPADLSSCESYILPVLSEGNYYTDVAGTGTMLNAGDEITVTQDIYIYADSGVAPVSCVTEHMFNVQIDTRPTLLPATPLEQCDDNFDGLAVFDLTPAGDEVINGQTGLTVTYHETEEGADFGTNVITDPTNHSIITGFIWIRVEETGTTSNCYSVEEVNIIVHERPTVPTISDYAQCDYNNPEGVETFDLTTRDSEVTFNDPDVTAVYYTSQADALAGTNPIPNPTTYANTGTPETIWAAAISSFGCRSVSSFDIIVNPLPATNPALGTFYACEEVPGEGEFDTITMDAEITLGASGYTISYYETQAAAEAAGTDYILSPFTAPTSTIYAHVVEDLTGCSIVIPVALEVIPAPIAPAPAPLEECDINNDQHAYFNLDPVLQNISTLLGDVSVTIHETDADAFYFANIIPNTGNYENLQDLTFSGVQTLHIRVQSTQTECFDIVTLDLIVHPIPDAAIPTDYALCDAGLDDTDGVTIFDLSTKDEEIL
ncbi:hypothetical protein E0W72_12620, partial [Flavobacterium arcticum]